VGIIRQKINSLKRIFSRVLYHGAGRTFYACFEGDPFGIQEHPKRQDQELLRAKFAELRQNNYGDVIEQLLAAFPVPELGADLDAIRPFMDDLARRTLVYNSPARLVHASGCILYSAVRFLARTRPGLRILETGTSRGFSSTIMARALHDTGCDGHIVTVDVLPPEKNLLWTGLEAPVMPVTRYELLQPWADLVERYVIYFQMDSPSGLEHLGLGHIDFAYIDAMHDYPSVLGEFAYVAGHQRPGDLVLFDDVGVQFPGVERAIKEIKVQCGYRERARLSSRYRPQPWLLCEKDKVEL
jgi:hypothetical protein